MLRSGVRSILRSRALYLQRNAFSTGSVLKKAEVFKMPAMSPTMEKGGIVSWKFKEGEAYNSGDVLLEVETDKAQIDVEAQDDGILAKIILNDGAKDVDVGTPIAITAEPGDDLATLALPDVSGSAPKAAAAPAPTPAAPKTESPAPTPAAPKTASVSVEGGKANPSQVLFPSVAALLSENGISKDEAIAKIPASGPYGRIVKGDVLAYLGKISKDSVNNIASFITSHSKLDLSNIEKHTITQKPEPKVEGAKAEAEVEKPKKAAPEPIVKTFSLDGVLALKNDAPELGIRSFSVDEYVTGASKRAERYAYQIHPKKSDYYDPIFEELIAPSKNVDRFTIKLDIPSVGSPVTKKTDPLDFVDGLLAAPESKSQSHEVKVTLTLNPKAGDAKEKADVYLEKFGQYLSAD